MRRAAEQGGEQREARSVKHSGRSGLVASRREKADLLAALRSRWEYGPTSSPFPSRRQSCRPRMTSSSQDSVLCRSSPWRSCWRWEVLKRDGVGSRRTEESKGPAQTPTKLSNAKSFWQRQNKNCPSKGESGRVEILTRRLF